VLDRHHYLGSGPLCGAQIRYLIWCESFGWQGGMSLSASASQLRARDEYRGWSRESQKQNLQLVVNNSRFLIAPHVKVPNLASHILLFCAWMTSLGPMLPSSLSLLKN